MGLAVTDHIYGIYATLAEGELAKLRASVVNTSALAAKGTELGLGPLLRLGKGEDHSGGRQKESILADSFEAVIGAVFVDSDWARARACVIRLLEEDIVRGAERPGGTDFKTRLQELVAKRDLGSPVYRIASSGPDHDRRFTAQVVIGGDPCGQGQGTSKKRAEQEAAEAAWVSLVNQKEAIDD